jgi:hypothetical protein
MTKYYAILIDENGVTIKRSRQSCLTYCNAQVAAEKMLKKVSFAATADVLIVKGAS